MVLLVPSLSLLYLFLKVFYLFIFYLFGDYFLSFLFLIFIAVQLLYNVVLVSAVQQSESAVRIHIAPVFWISFTFRSPQSTE